MADVFLSYKKEDRAIAERLVAALHKAGKSVWWDDALNPHQAWDAMIEQEIAAARVVVVLWSSRSVRSDWVRSEAHYAQDHDKLVPVMIEPCTLPIAFMLRQSVDLSSGKLDSSNPNWVKLLEWIGEKSADQAHTPDPEVARASVPLKALTGARWLGPARRSRWAIAVIAAILLAASSLFLLRNHLPFGQPDQPDVVVDPMSTGDSKAIPASFARGVNDEVFAGLSGSSLISPLPGDGRSRPAAYRLAGDMSIAGTKLALFAKIYAPNVEAPVLTTRLEADAGNRDAAARLFGNKLALLIRCVATASDSAGSETTILPPKALLPWAQFCQQTTISPAAPDAVSGTLRKVTALAPDFANGWASLSEALYMTSTQLNVDRAGLRAEATRAGDRALTLDPRSAKAWSIKALMALGIGGPDRGDTLLGRLGDFEQWEKLAEKSISVRPSDCGCEGPTYAFTLAALGRANAAFPMMQRAVGSDSAAVGHVIGLAHMMGLVGQTGGAERMLKELAEQWPSIQGIAGARFLNALWGRDWANARTMLPGMPDSPEKAAWPALLDALAKGSPAGIRAAGAPFVSMAANPNELTETNAVALVLAGYDDEAMTAMEKATAASGMQNLIIFFEPPMTPILAMPRFAEFARRVGLVDYWRMPGHTPDFCRNAAPPTFCKSIS